MATDKAPAFKFTTNIPVKATIRFVDVRPGKLWADPEKGGAQKQLPPQVSIKGTFDGKDTIAFLPGPVWKNVKALVEGGVIADDHDTDALEAVTQATALPVIGGEGLTITLTKLAGERYEHLVYTRPGQPTPVASKRIPPPSGAPPQGSGKLLPFDEGYEADAPNLAPNPQNAKLHGGPMPGPLHGDEDEPTSALDAKEAGEAIQREALADAYCTLYEDVLTHLARHHRARADIKDPIPLDSTAVQAATATIWIAWDKMGLQRGIASAALQRAVTED